MDLHSELQAGYRPSLIIRFALSIRTCSGFSGSYIGGLRATRRSADQKRADDADGGGIAGEDADDAKVTLDLLLHVPERVGDCGLGPVRVMEGHECQYVLLRVAHKLA